MKKYCFPIMLSFSILLVGTFLASFLYFFDIISVKFNGIFLYLTGFISIFAGSLYLSKILKFKGVINGVLFFLLFNILTVFIAFLFFNLNLNLKSFLFFLLSFCFSTLGGIIGKNINLEEQK